MAPSPLSETVRQRATSSTPAGPPPNLSQFFSTPLIHTRCKVQLLIQQALHGALHDCFPIREGRAKAFLPTGHHKEGLHFRPSLTGADTAILSASRPTPSTADASPSATLPPTHPTTPSKPSPTVVTGEEETDSVHQRRPSAVQRYNRRDDPRIFGHFLPSHLLYCLSIFSLTLSFSHDFNADIALRKKLYGAGLHHRTDGTPPSAVRTGGEGHSVRVVHHVSHVEGGRHTAGAE